MSDARSFADQFTRHAVDFRERAIRLSGLGEAVPLTALKEIYGDGTERLGYLLTAAYDAGFFRTIPGLGERVHYHRKGTPPWRGPTQLLFDVLSDVLPKAALEPFPKTTPPAGASGWGADLCLLAAAACDYLAAQLCAEATGGKSDAGSVAQEPAPQGNGLPYWINVNFKAKQHKLLKLLWNRDEVPIGDLERAIWGSANNEKNLENLRKLRTRTEKKLAEASSNNPDAMYHIAVRRNEVFALVPLE